MCTSFQCTMYYVVCNVKIVIFNTQTTDSMIETEKSHACTKEWYKNIFTVPMLVYVHVLSSCYELLPPSLVPSVCDTLCPPLWLLRMASC